MKVLEFWPDYGSVLLHSGGTPVDIESLGLDAELVSRAQVWVSGYDDAKVDPEGWDEAWVGEGRRLLHELREGLEPHGFEVTDWEGIWTAPEFEEPGEFTGR